MRLKSKDDPFCFDINQVDLKESDYNFQDQTDMLFKNTTAENHSSEFSWHPIPCPFLWADFSLPHSYSLQKTKPSFESPGVQEDRHSLSTCAWQKWQLLLRAFAGWPNTPGKKKKYSAEGSHHFSYSKIAKPSLHGWVLSQRTLVPQIHWKYQEGHHFTNEREKKLVSGGCRNPNFHIVMVV